MILAAAAAAAQQWSLTDTGGTVTLGTDLTLAGATVASPAGTFSMSCPATALPPGTYQAEWVCTGGTVTIQSNDGLTTVGGNLTSGTFIETASGGGRGNPTKYYYVFTGTFTGTISLSGQMQAITGSTVQSLAGSTSQLGTGTIAGGTTFVNADYEPVYVADTYNNRIVRMDDMTGANWITFGTSGAGTNQFQSPYGISADTHGRIYATDNINCRVVRIDNMSGKNWTTFGACGSGNLQFNNPTGIFVDSAGKIYVTDTGNNRVVRVSDMAGDGWVAYGAAGSGTGQFGAPVGVAVDSAGKIYISDTNNARIVRMDNMSGTNWTTFSGVISGIDQLGSPVAISLDGAGRIYVLDWYFAHVIRTDDMSGTNFTTMGNFGGGVGQFINPYGLYVDSYGTIYVADSHDNRIAQFDDMSADAWTAYGACCLGTGQFDLPMGVFALPLKTPTPDGKISTASLSYRNTVVGTPSASQSVTLSNIGSAPLTITSISPSGDFTQTNTCPGTLPAGQNCVVSVTFAPTAPGPRTGSVAFSFAGAAAKNVHVNGIGTLVSVSPTALNFGNVPASGRGVSMTVTVSNPGISTAGIASVTLKAAAVYRLSNACPATLAVGASCAVTVRFYPQGAEYYTGTLTITDGSGTAQEVPITGTGVSN
ncbi:MAG: choice-of-anchor D domain-containing protein [Bryobacteraceae bacterium]|jgi:streptogramin lyase